MVFLLFILQFYGKVTSICLSLRPSGRPLKIFLKGSTGLSLTESNADKSEIDLRDKRSDQLAKGFKLVSF